MSKGGILIQYIDLNLHCTHQGVAGTMSHKIFHWCVRHLLFSQVSKLRTTQCQSDWWVEIETSIQTNSHNLIKKQSISVGWILHGTSLLTSATKSVPPTIYLQISRKLLYYPEPPRRSLYISVTTGVVRARTLIWYWNSAFRRKNAYWKCITISY